jgi:hypothetical protein
MRMKDAHRKTWADCALWMPARDPAANAATGRPVQARISSAARARACTPKPMQRSSG